MGNIHFGRIAAIIIKAIISIIPKNRKLILFSAWFGKKYGENSGYLFEYMQRNSNYHVYWYTKDPSLYDDLRAKNIPVVYSKTVKAIWYQIRAVMLVSAVQFEDFNKFLLKKCIYLDLDHGFPGKVCGLKTREAIESGSTWYNFLKSDVDFYQTASSKFVVDILQPYYDVTPDHYIFSNKPRIDVFYDSSLVEGRNSIIDNIKNGRKAFVYLPTHRASGKKQMSLAEILDLNEIQSICEKTNSVFIVKKHFFHREEREYLDNYPNIFDVTTESIDTQVLLAQTDVLITDFSSCFIDFLAVDKPIIFYAFDYDDYLSNDRDYYWKYDMIDSGYTTKTKEEFNNSLKAVASDWKDLIHEKGRKKMKYVYFDPEVEMGSSRKKLMGIIEQLINNTYKPFDWSKKR